jgi:hypothetical protein
MNLARSRSSAAAKPTDSDPSIASWRSLQSLQAGSRHRPTPVPAPRATRARLSPGKHFAIAYSAGHGHAPPVPGAVIANRRYSCSVISRTETGRGDVRDAPLRELHRPGTAARRGARAHRRLHLRSHPAGRVEHIARRGEGHQDPPIRTVNFLRPMPQDLAAYRLGTLAVAWQAVSSSSRAGRQPLARHRLPQLASPRLSARRGRGGHRDEHGQAAARRQQAAALRRSPSLRPAPHVRVAVDPEGRSIAYVAEQAGHTVEECARTYTICSTSTETLGRCRPRT